MNKPTDAARTDNSNRPAEADELNFENDQPSPGFGEESEFQEEDPSVRNVGLTEASQPGQGPTDDDLTPETLITEDGARSRDEDQQGNLEPNDKTLSVVSGNDIGAGGGLDEAELARVDPLNRQKKD
jgi:hypothetical protein